MTEYLPFLIPVVAVAVFVLGSIGVMKLQKASLGRIEPGATTHGGFGQAPGESREEFVRRHWQRSGVVANGVTLVDLYDRIRALEERVARAERR